MKEKIFVQFLDEKIIHLFKMNYFSIRNIYQEEKILIGTTKKGKKLLEKYVKNDLNIIVKVVNKKMLNFKSLGLYEYITNFAFARFFIKDIFNKVDFFNKTVIYLDIDTILLKEIPEKYTKGNENWIFGIELWNSVIKKIDEFSKRYDGSLNDQNITELLNHHDYFRISLENLFNWEIENQLKEELKSDINKFIFSYVKQKRYANTGILIINDLPLFDSMFKNVNEKYPGISQRTNDEFIMNIFGLEYLNFSSDRYMNFSQFYSDFDSSLESGDINILHFFGKDKSKMDEIYTWLRKGL